MAELGLELSPTSHLPDFSDNHPLTGSPWLRRGFSKPTSWLALLPSWLGCEAGVAVGCSQEDSGYSVNTSCQYLLLPGAEPPPPTCCPLQVLQTGLKKRTKAKCRDPN